MPGSVNNLALIHRILGEYGEAEALLRRVVGGLSALLDATHPELSSARISLVTTPLD